jgi:hypothetical protein
LIEKLTYAQKIKMPKAPPMIPNIPCCPP